MVAKAFQPQLELFRTPPARADEAYRANDEVQWTVRCSADPGFTFAGLTHSRSLYRAAEDARSELERLAFMGAPSGCYRVTFTTRAGRELGSRLLRVLKTPHLGVRVHLW